MATAASGGNVLHQIQIQIVGNLQLLVQNLQNAQNQTQKTTQSMQSNFQKVTDSVSKLADKLRIIPNYLSGIAGAGAAVLGGLAVKNFIEDIVKLAARVEVLEVVSAQVGKVAGHSATEINQLVQAIKNMNITTQQANLTVALMIQANLDLSKATQLARTAQDAAVLANVSSQEALRGLVHGIVTLQPEVLRTYKIITNLELAYRRYAASIGISFDELDQQTKQTIALNEVLRVGARIHGTYEAAMTKAGKQLLSLERVTEEFKLSMGREFQEGFARLIKSLTDFFNTARQSENLHAAFKLIANVLDNLLQKLMWLANFAVKNPNLIIQIFNIAAITMVTRAIGGLAGSIALLIKTLTMGAWIDKVGVIAFVASALGYALSKLPFYISAVTAALSPLIGVMVVFRVGMLEAARAVLSFNGTLALAATTLPGMLGVIGLIAGAVGLLISAFGGIGKNAREAEDRLAQLRLEANQSATEYKDLHSQAIELMDAYVKMYETTEDSEQKQKDLKETLDDIQKMVPGYLKGITDLTEAYNAMKDAADGSAGAIRKLAMENAGLTIGALKQRNAEIEQQLPNIIKASQKALSEYSSWLQDNIQVGAAFTDFNKDIPGVQAAVLFGNQIVELVNKLKDLDDQARKGMDVREELVAVQDQWTQLTDQMGKFTSFESEASQVTKGLVADMRKEGETAIFNAMQIKVLRDEWDKNVETMKEAEKVRKTGERPKPIVEIPEVQKEDLRKLNDLLDRLQKKVFDWSTKGLKPTLESVKAGVKADVDSAILELRAIEESLTSIATKPQYREYKDQIAKFQEVSNAIQRTRAVIVAAGNRVELEELAKFDVQQRSLREGMIKSQVEAGIVGIEELKGFYKAEIDLVTGYGETASDEQKKQLWAMQAELAGIDAAELEKKERHYKSMLKFDESYYAKLKGVLEQKLPMVEAKYGKESEQYVQAKEEIDTLDKLRISHHADRYKRMAGLDGKYYDEYITTLDESISEAEKLYGTESEIYKQMVAEKKNAEEDFLSWRKGEWAKQAFYMQGVLDFMEGSWSAMVQSFTDMEMTGKKRRQQIWESMRSIFIQIIGQMIQKYLTFLMLQAMFPSVFGGQTFGQWLSGKQEGGYTGDKPEDEVAGFHHGREYVLNAKATKKYRPLLEMMNQGLDIKRYLGAVMPNISMYGAGGGQASILLGVSKVMNRLTETLANGIMPVRVEMRPVTVVSERGIHLASVEGEHKQKRVQL